MCIHPRGPIRLCQVTFCTIVCRWHLRLVSGTDWVRKSSLLIWVPSARDWEIWTGPHKVRPCRKCLLDQLLSMLRWATAIWARKLREERTQGDLVLCLLLEAQQKPFLYSILRFRCSSPIVVSPLRLLVTHDIETTRREGTAAFEVVLRSTRPIWSSRGSCGGSTSGPSYTKAISRLIDPFDRPRAGQRFVLSIKGIPGYKTETGSGRNRPFFGFGTSVSGVEGF